MTPKEKANELVNSFRIILMNEDTDCGNEILCTLISIKCALIAVDEIIKTLNEDIKDINVVGNILLDLIDYWQQVKQEIEKL